MKKLTKKLSLKTETIRYLQAEELANVAGGSIAASGPSVISVGPSVISRNPSGGLPSGGLPSGGLPSGGRVSY
jgi:hypothetical protein